LDVDKECLKVIFRVKSAYSRSVFNDSSPAQKGFRSHFCDPTLAKKEVKKRK
jgi:hypothetical protein